MGKVFTFYLPEYIGNKIVHSRIYYLNYQSFEHQFHESQSRSPSCEGLSTALPIEELLGSNHCPRTQRRTRWHDRKSHALGSHNLLRS